MCAFVAAHAGAGTHPHKTEDVCLKAVCKSKGDIVEVVKVCVFAFIRVNYFRKLFLGEIVWHSIKVSGTYD